MNLSKTIGIFLLFLFVIIYRSVKFNNWNICVACCIRGHHKKVFKIKEFDDTIFFHIYKWLFKFHGKPSNLHILLIPLKRWDSLEKECFALLKIYRHVMPSQRNVSTWNTPGQWNNRAPSIHSMQTGASQKINSVIVMFQAHMF